MPSPSRRKRQEAARKRVTQKQRKGAAALKKRGVKVGGLIQRRQKALDDILSSM